jgi:hypothetical protein
MFTTGIQYVILQKSTLCISDAYWSAFEQGRCYKYTSSHKIKSHCLTKQWLSGIEVKLYSTLSNSISKIKGVYGRMPLEPVSL